MVWRKTIAEADHKDRHNKGIKQWAKNCERHVREGRDN